MKVICLKSSDGITTYYLKIWHPSDLDSCSWVGALHFDEAMRVSPDEATSIVEVMSMRHPDNRITMEDA